MENERVRITGEEILSDNFYTLKKITYDLRRTDGRWQKQEREAYAGGNGVTALLYNKNNRTVLMTRQFRVPAYLNKHDGFMIETPAGMLDGEPPEKRVRAEVEEETGYRAENLEKVLELFMSPASVTERVHLFIGEYDPDKRVGDGGGLDEEGEDIEVFELAFDEALAMVARGEIVDAKTVILLQYLQLRHARIDGEQGSEAR